MSVDLEQINCTFSIASEGKYLNSQLVCSEEKNVNRFYSKTSIKSTAFLNTNHVTCLTVHFKLLTLYYSKVYLKISKPGASGLAFSSAGELHHFMFM